MDFILSCHFALETLMIRYNRTIGCASNSDTVFATTYSEAINVAISIEQTFRSQYSCITNESYLKRIEASVDCMCWNWHRVLLTNPYCSYNHDLPIYQTQDTNIRVQILSDMFLVLTCSIPS